VPITDLLRQELLRAAEAATSQYVIEHAGGRVASIKTGFRAAVRRARLRDVTPHALRHTAATWMVQEGVSLAKVARYLGNTEAMVEKVYGHHSPEYLRDAAEALAGSSNRYSPPIGRENQLVSESQKS
jgi:integrase